MLNLCSTTVEGGKKMHWSLALVKHHCLGIIIMKLDFTSQLPISNVTTDDKPKIHY